MRELLALLPKPSRYAGIEEGSVHKRAEAVTLRVGLAFPDMYEVGMSYLGQKILYGIINTRPHWQAERVFTPCREAGAILKAHNSPLSTLESDTPLARLDALGVSVTHELCYSNILYMFDLAGIPFRAADRLSPQPDGRPWPLIVAGGGCTLAAEPLAPFVDAMILGEGEESLPELLETLEHARAAGKSRHDLLLDLSRIPGVYVPEFFEEAPPAACPAPPAETPFPQTRLTHVRPLYAEYPHVTRRVIPDMDSAPYPASQPIPFGAVHNRLALEIGRGCTRGCRFCQAGSIYRPARERSVARLSELLHSCLAETGFDDVSYLSLSTGDFSALKELFMNTVDRCRAEQISVSLPSLRVGSIDDAIMERMAGIRRTGATLAPEAGSQRLRDVINKGVTEDELLLHVQKLFEHGWQQVKLYFMIGLPTETDEDLHAIIDLCRKARDCAGPGIKRLQVTAAVSPFVPKPHTPFQWEAQIPRAEIHRRIGVLLDAVRKEKRIKLRWHEADMSTLEGIFSRGDRRLADVVETAYAKGAIFASWMEGFSLEPWLEALTEHGLSPEEYTGAIPKDAILPWDHLRSGLSKEFFLREWNKSVRQQTSPDCRYTVCQVCGVCDTKAGPSLLDSLPGRTGGYGNVLNNSQRDQQAHTVTLDQYGRVMVRGDAVHNPSEGEDTPPPQKPARQSKAKPPALAPHLADKAAQLRIWYARAGAAVYLSQLELQNIFERALRRAALPLSFSQGFHPLPRISFGRALPVGVASECEWFSIYLREERSLQAAFAALTQGLPEGLRITAVEALPLQKSGADAPQETYRMEALVQEEQPAFQEAWRRVAALQTLPWLRETKKGPRTLDSRAFFANITCNSDASCTLHLDWSKGYVSPLALCVQVLESIGFPVALPRIRLTKTASKGA